MPLQNHDIIAMSRLLDAALDLPPAERAAWLAALPAAEQHLLPLLQDMLAAHDSTRGSTLLAALPRLAALEEAAIARPGELVGPYRLLHEIGRGGMGAVWLAERADGAFARQVALKLPHLTWGEGLAARMARECAIGARLEHPHIARLYDAGVDALGRPFLALEYIAGQSIDSWCAEQRLSMTERLRLVMQIAQAVAYAHGRLVVHRDLKPSNVLVSPDGQVHLLDFGIAKLLDEAERESGGGLTQDLGRMLTPQFASPEHLRGEPLTVQSDVYSLGVLAFMLLTGQTPYAPKRGSMAALEEAILADEPALASQRAPDPATARALCGDIDAIIGKALKRAPAERYTTAAALADDIARCLSGSVVQARPDTWHYRLSKALRRDAAAFTAGALILLAILVGAGAAWLQARRANAEAERARVVKEFVIDIFKLNTPGTPEARAARELPVELLLARGARLIEPRFAGQPALQLELLGVVTRIMVEMNAQQLAVQYASHYRSALMAAGAPPDEVARAALLMAEALRANDLVGEAGRVLNEALMQASEPEMLAEIRLQLLDLALARYDFSEARQQLKAARRHIATPEGLLAARVDQAEARLLTDTEAFDRARPLFERAIAAAQAAQEKGSRLAAQFRMGYAAQLASHGDIPAARTAYDQALGDLRASVGPDDIEAALQEAESITQLATAERGAIGYKKAMAVFAHTLAVIDQQRPSLPPHVRAKVEDAQGCVELRFGQAEKGLALAQGTLPVLRPYSGGGHRGSCLGWALMMAGRHVEAEAEFQKYLGHLWLSHGCKSDCAATMFVATAHNRVMQGRYQEAQAMLDTVPSALAASPSPNRASRPQLDVLLARARLELEQGHYARVIELLEGVPDGQYLMNNAAALRAEALCRSGRASDALPALRTAVVDLESTTATSPWLADARARLGLCELLAGHPEPARQMSRLAHQAFDAQPGVSPAYRRVLAALDRRLKQIPRLSSSHANVRLYEHPHHQG